VGRVGAGTVVLARVGRVRGGCVSAGFSTRVSGRARRCWVWSSQPCSPPSWPGWVGLVVAGDRIPCGAGRRADRGRPSGSSPARPPGPAVVSDQHRPPRCGGRCHPRLKRRRPGSGRHGGAARRVRDARPAPPGALAAAMSRSPAARPVPRLRRLGVLLLGAAAVLWCRVGRRRAAGDRPGQP